MEYGFIKYSTCKLNCEQLIFQGIIVAAQFYCEMFRTGNNLVSKVKKTHALNYFCSRA